MNNLIYLFAFFIWVLISILSFLYCEWYYIATWFTLGTPSFYFGTRQINEEVVLNTFLTNHDLHGAPVTHDTAVSVSQSLRSLFNTNEEQFKHYSRRNRPFLRESSTFLLHTKEGLCGEGARVLVCLLSKLGFDATRITLYTKNLTPSHTLVSIFIDEKEYLIDTINTREPVNRFINENHLSTDTFTFLANEEIVNAPEAVEPIDATKRIDKEDEIKEIFFTRFLYYSYEAIPLDKLMRCLNLQTKSINLKRPGKLVSVLAEKPYFLLMIMFLSLYAVALVLIFIITS